MTTMKFTIVTFGCKVNQYESNMMKEQMLQHHFLYVDKITEADIFIINTCTVTNTADQKCLKLVRRYLRNYPDKVSVVVGCSVQNNEAKYQDLGINILLGNKDKSQVAEIISKYLTDKQAYQFITKNRQLPFENMQLETYDHIRAFIKIEDGCDNFCSYCIIPFVRGKVRSKDYDLVLAEAKCLAKNHPEIVLTGIHTGHYFSNGHDLADLIIDLSKIPELKRIRLSSIEVTELNDHFLATLKNCPKLVDHLHIPLQAGSDFVLKAMNRKYDIAYFREKIAEIRQIRPNIAISTDIIVGFPGETEAMFQETLAISQKLAFSKVHVFPFSPRKGTVAAAMDNQVSEAEKHERVKRLMALSAELEKEYYQKFHGQTVDVLIEKSTDGKSVGHTGNYLEVTLNETLTVGQIYSRVL